MNILLDKDGVLYNLYEPWYAEHNADYGHIHLMTLDDIYTWDTQQICRDHNCPSDMASYFLNPRIWIDGPAFDGAFEITRSWVNSGHDITVITNIANSIAAKPSWDWLNIYFPHIPNLMMISQPIKHWAIADVLIDDGIHNHIGFLGISILFDRPWNQNADLVRAMSWEHLNRIVQRADELLQHYDMQDPESMGSYRYHKWIEERLKQEIQEGIL